MDQFAAWQTPQISSNQRASEHTSYSSRMKTGSVKAATGCRGHARNDLNTENVGDHNITDGGVGLDSRRQRGRKHRGRWMNNAPGVCVVKVQAMAKKSINLCRVAQRETDGKSNNGHHLFSPACQNTSRRKRAMRKIMLPGC